MFTGILLVIVLLAPGSGDYYSAVGAFKTVEECQIAGVELLASIRKNAPDGALFTAACVKPTLLNPVAS